MAQLRPGCSFLLSVLRFLDRWCFEKSLKFLTKNAYILIAFEGTSFCKSAKAAFWLILSNIAQIAVVSFIKFFLMLLGKLLIVVGSVAVAFILIEGMEDGPRYIVIPLLLIAFLSYVISSFFLNVYEMTIATILLSFCVDRKRNDGSVEKPYIMPDTLKKALRVSNKVAAPGEEKKQSDAEMVVKAANVAGVKIGE